MNPEMVAGVRRDEEDAVGGTECGGYTLLDPLGQKLGRVERVFCNWDGEPQYVRIQTGIFGQRLALIPVMDIAVDHENRDLTLR